MRSTKKLFKVKTFILEQHDINISVFDRTEHCLFLHDVLNVKKHIRRSVSDHIDNSAFKN